MFKKKLYIYYIIRTKKILLSSSLNKFITYKNKNEKKYIETIFT